jgi:hypothetical protein
VTVRLRHAIALTFVLCALAPAASAQTRHDVEYVAGDRLWKCGGTCKGTLVMIEGALTLTERRKNNPKVIFRLPLTTIVKVNNRTQSHGPEVGAVLAFGLIGLASAGEDEYVSITAETATKSETFVFKVQKHAAEGIAAKIEFAVKQAKAVDAPLP